jgi:hypothetical protein
VRKILLVAVIAAAVLVPAAGASRARAVKLALVPLPKSAIGATVQSFAVAFDSGPISNADAAAQTPDASAKKLKKLGRINGYGLEYGNAFNGAVGVGDVRTSIESYKTPADARRGLAFWKKEDSTLQKLDNPNFSVTSLPVKLPAPAPKTSHFAYLTSYSAANIASVSGIDEQIADGRYVLDVIVTADTPDAAVALAPTLAKKLDARFRLARKGRLHASRVKVPKQTAGPPSGGPDLKPLALRATDLVGDVHVDRGYFNDPVAISDYSVFMFPAGHFDLLDQEIEWYSTANEASFYTDFANAATLAEKGTTALDLSSLGDGAQGSVTHQSALDTGQVFFSSGQLAEFIFMASLNSIDPNDVMSVAQTAASRIDAAGLGS